MLKPLKPDLDQTSIPSRPVRFRLIQPPVVYLDELEVPAFPERPRRRKGPPREQPGVADVKPNRTLN